MLDYVPRVDTNFTKWVGNFTDYAAANAVSLGLTPTDIADLETLFNQWCADYTAAYVARANYLGLVDTKKQSRKVSEQYVRKLVRQIQANPAITDSQRASYNYPG
jgi:hypothetical protein